MTPKNKILENFIECVLLTEKWVGYAPHAFLQLAFSNYKSLGFPTEHFSERGMLRKDIFELVENSSVSDFECLISILAWGQIRYNNMRYVEPMFPELCKIISTLRNKPVDRTSAYKLFSNLRAQGLKGIGPAYFTKIIYFWTHNSKDRGYILDQWTARSTNLIFGEPLVILDKFQRFQRVSDANNEKHYDKFCIGIELVTKALKSFNETHHLVMSSDEVQRKMFSAGGKRKVSWRAFVLSHTREKETT